MSVYDHMSLNLEQNAIIQFRCIVKLFKIIVA